MLSNLIGGLSVGSLYGLIAVGVALVYRTTGLVNFAQGELVAIGAYAYIFATAWGGSPLVTMLVARGGPGLLDSLAATISYSLVPITPPVSCSPPSPPPGHAPAVVMAD